MTLKQPMTKQQEFQWAFQGPISWPFSFIKDHDLIHQNPKAKGQLRKSTHREVPKKHDTPLNLGGCVVVRVGTKSTNTYFEERGGKRI